MTESYPRGLIVIRSDPPRSATLKNLALIGICYVMKCTHALELIAALDLLVGLAMAIGICRNHLVSSFRIALPCIRPLYQLLCP
eukprot:1277681-Pleurochrysis_carterae.AAC.1